eukprot:TRINITY_DN123_c1_g1_i1.p1 TRINITY_DN123_c1_g1~~TRINITY_DN123_c1_g1_i1.p1  ORF type:complete len:670 (-),score=159.35 TRINITY_DN123_c1_g1_i1:230-2239(-)
MTEKLQGTIILSVNKATNLANKDTFGFSDPYVHIKATSAEQRPLLDIKTKIIEDNLNPIWNERFSVIMDEATAGVKLELEVFDQDNVGNDEPLGFVELDVDSNFKFNADQDRDLKQRKSSDGDVKGKLFFKVEYRKGQQVRLNDNLPPKKEEKSLKELPLEARQKLREWRACGDALTNDEEVKLKLLGDIYFNNFNNRAVEFEMQTHKLAMLIEYKKAQHPVSSDDISPMKWLNRMKDKDGAFINEAKDIIEAVCNFQQAKKASYRDGYLNDPEGLFCEELKGWASKELSLLSFGKETFGYLDKRLSYLEEVLLVPDLFDSTSSLAKETIQQVIVKVRRIVKYRAYAAVEKELAHEDATRSFNDLKKHLAGLVRICAQFLKNVFKCETPPEVLSTADRVLLTIESDPNIRAVIGDELKTTVENIKGYNDTGTFEGPWASIDLRERGLHPTLQFLDPVELDPKDPLLPVIFKGLHSGVEEYFRGNGYIAYHFLKAHGLLLEAGRLFVVIEKAANCAKTGGTLLVFGLANAQLNATLDSTKAIMDTLKEEFTTVAKIAECCFEELVFANQATKERTAWIKYFKHVFPGINELTAQVEKIQEEVAEIKETANSMTLQQRIQQANNENNDFLSTADEFSARIAKVTGKPYVKPKPKELSEDEMGDMMKLIGGK